MKVLVRIIEVLTQEYTIANPFRKEEREISFVRLTRDVSLTWAECDKLLSQLDNI